MFCSNCGYKLEDGVKFCPNCGTSQTKTENTQSVTEIPIATQQKTDTNEQFQSSVKIGFVQAMKLYFENLLNFKGRATRSEYWWSFLFNMVLWGIILSVLESTSYDCLEMCLVGFMILFTSSIRVRRLHDVGLFGFSEILLIPFTFIFLITGQFIAKTEIPGSALFIPFIGSAIIAFIGSVLSWIFACKKSSPKMNKWGVNIRMQSKEENTVHVTSKKAWRNVGLSLVATVVVFVVCIIVQNNSYTPVVASAGITQSESGQVGNEQSVEQSSGNIRSHWTDNYPAKKWFVREESGRNYFILKKDINTRIYLVVLNEDEPFRDVLSLFILTDKGNSQIALSKPNGMLLPFDERIDMANKLIRIVERNINKPYAAFMEKIKKDSQKLLLKTAVIKPGYKTVNKTDFVSEYDGHQIDAAGREMQALKWKSVPWNRVVEERDSSKDMHVRPYKIIQIDHSSDKVETTNFNNLPVELFEYQGQL